MGGTTQPLHPMKRSVVGGFELNAALFGLFLDVLTDRSLHAQLVSTHSATLGVSEPIKLFKESDFSSVQILVNGGGSHADLCTASNSPPQPISLITAFL